MFCNNCGRKLADDDKFCPECGKQVKVQPAREEIPVGSAYSYVPPKHNAREVLREEPPVYAAPKAEPVKQKQFCLNCGQPLAEGNAYCLNCGQKAGTVPTAQKSAPKKKRGKRTAGIVLLALQLLGAFGAAASGTFGDILHITCMADVFEMLGYYSPAIVGIILLIVDKKQNG